jgi:hypothetical protein
MREGSVMKGSVKIMLSYDYSHFEVALSSDDNLDAEGVNALRKTAQRLADEAVRQYKEAKKAAELRAQSIYDKESFLRQIKRIEATPEADRSVQDIAALKQFTDEDWENQFRHDYDYRDDEVDFGEGA